MIKQNHKIKLKQIFNEKNHYKNNNKNNKSKKLFRVLKFIKKNKNY